MSPPYGAARRSATEGAVDPPLEAFRATEARRPTRVHRGLDAWNHRVHGFFHSRRVAPGLVLARGRRVAEAANALRALGENELRAGIARAAAELRRCPWTRPAPDSLADTAMALLVEAARRTLRLAAHPEQVAAALALGEGVVVEQATGEGKTLSIGLAAALAAHRGRPCHVVTANDYLVRRDAEWLAPFYALCGLDVGFVQGSMNATARRQAYAMEVTYVTSREAMADFLRDRLALGPLVDPSRRLLGRLAGLEGSPGAQGPAVTIQRGLHSAIVDEADHVLIDEAVTPLIISRPLARSDLVDACRVAARLADDLIERVHYRVLPAYREIELTRDGERHLESRTAGFDGIWRAPRRREELVIQALVARHFFRRGDQYVIDEEGKIVIVDEFTGRTMADRTWKQGLQQAIEAKESLQPTQPTETLARLSFQRFFRLYGRLAGITGTARESAREFWDIYRLPTVPLPTHRPCRRVHHRMRCHPDAESKWNAIADEIRGMNAAGRPVLAGTRSVQASEHLAALLGERGHSVHVLNAVRHRHEAEIIAEAGQPRTITISTNMAGRGTDIRPTASVLEHGGLAVIATEPHAAARIDRQLFGRSGRQGEPGSAVLFASLDDDLPRRFLPAWLRRAVAGMLRLGLPGGSALARIAVSAAQRRAQSLAYRQRSSVLRQDDWLEEALSFSGRSVERR